MPSLWASAPDPSSDNPGPTAPLSEHTRVKGKGVATEDERQAAEDEETGARNVDKDKSNSRTVKGLLEPFSMSDLPSTSRVDTSVPQRQAKAPPLYQVWKFVPFFAKQATSIVTTLGSHHIWGPARPTWGPGMAIFTSCLRVSADFSHLSNIQLLRWMLDFGQLVPPSKEGVITPVTFKVRRRRLKGFLSEVDRAEDGTRTLSGEWVVSRRDWVDMQREYRAQNLQGGSGRHMTSGRVMLYLHGGAYYIMSPASHRSLTIAIAKHTGLSLFALDYRLSPETIFPGALYDAVQAYFRLVYDLKIPPENILLGGDSAGGGLTTALLMYLRDNDYPMPSAALLISPWVDLTMSCASWDTNAKFDYLPAPLAGDHLNPISCYLGHNIKKYITHPYASPLFGDLRGLPPLLIQSGEIEVLVDEGSLLAHKATLADVYVEHEIYKDMPHVHVAFLFLEAAREALASQRRFVRKTLPKIVPAKRYDRRTVDGEIAHDAHRVRTDGKAETVQVHPESPLPSDEDFGYIGESSGVDSEGASSGSGSPSSTGAEAIESEPDTPQATRLALSEADKVLKRTAKTGAEGEKVESLNGDDAEGESDGASLGLSMGARTKSTRRARAPSLTNNLPPRDTASLAKQIGSIINGQSDDVTPPSRQLSRTHSRTRSYSHMSRNTSRGNVHFDEGTAGPSDHRNDTFPSSAYSAPSSPRVRRGASLSHIPSPALRNPHADERTTPLPTPSLTPRGRQSHPELVALMDSYDAMRAAHHTVLVEKTQPRRPHGHGAILKGDEANGGYFDSTAGH